MEQAIRQRMADTGWTYEQVLEELEMMRAAKHRYETNQLTEEDKRAIRECEAHWQPQ